MADTKITALTEATSLASTDLLVCVVQPGTTPITRKILKSNLSTWVTWVPTPTNLTVGNGTLTAKYLELGHLVAVSVMFTLGSSSAVGTSPSLTLPVTATTRGVWQAQYSDTGTAYYIGRAEALTGSLYFYRSFVTGADLQITAITASIPFTWTTGDIITIGGVYGI